MPFALRKARVALFPQDARALEDYVRALEKANRLPEADQALAGGQALAPERRLLLRADLLTSHGDHRGAFQVLDGAVAEPWSMDFRRAYVARVDKGSIASPATWRATLESRFDARRWCGSPPTSRARVAATRWPTCSARWIAAMARTWAAGNSFCGTPPR